MEKKKVAKKTGKSVTQSSRETQLEVIERLIQLKVTHFKTHDLEVVIHPLAFSPVEAPKTTEKLETKPEVDLDELAFQTAYKGGK